MGQWEQAITGTADAGGLCEASWTVPVGRPVRMERMVATGESVVQPVGSEETVQRYRGTWIGDGPLKYSQAFDAEEVPAEIGYVSKTGAAVRVGIATAPAASGVPQYGYAVRVQTLNSATWWGARLNVPGIPGLSGVRITRVKAFVLAQPTASRPVSAGGKAGGLNQWGGVTRALADPLAWDEIDMRANATDYEFGGTKATGGSGGNPYVWVTGIRVWGLSLTDAYQLGDTVSWNGYIWECMTAATVAAPGAAGAWRQVDGTMASTGSPELLVYRNGVLLDTTGNANADVSNGMNLAMNPGDSIRAHWQRVSPGAAMRLTMGGED